jgi:serine phosphatase RsbU (regulator of sigma subunit)
VIRDEFGEERLIEVLKEHRGEPAAEIVESATKALAEFAAGAPPGGLHYVDGE